MDTKELCHQLARTLNANRADWYLVSDIILTLEDLGITVDKAEFASKALKETIADMEHNLKFAIRLTS